MDRCKICGKEIPKDKKVCSMECAKIYVDNKHIKYSSQGRYQGAILKAYKCIRRPDLIKWNRSHPNNLTPEARTRAAVSRNKRLNNRIPGFAVSAKEYEIYKYLKSHFGENVTPQFKINSDKFFTNNYKYYDIRVDLPNGVKLFD